MATETSICNEALTRVATGVQLASLQDPNATARRCKVLYPHCRDLLLRSHPWNFAIKRLTLTADTTAPAFGWALRYELPSDFLRALEISGDNAYEIEGNYLLSDTASITLRYVRQETDATLFDALFVQALTALIAAKLAYPLTNDLRVKQQQWTIYERISRAVAQQVDAMENRQRKRYAWEQSSLVAARGAGGSSTAWPWEVYPL